MVHANFIAKRIDSTCDIVGGEANLIKMGFQNVMGYITMLTDINKSDVKTVATMLFQLYSMDGIYKEFALHILKNGILYDGFFTFDSDLNPASDNLERMFEEMISMKSDDSSADFDKIVSEDKSKFEEYYEKNKKLIKNNVNSNFGENSEEKEKYESFQNFNKMFDLKIDAFKSKFDNNAISWLESNVSSMSDDDYGMLMSMIYKLRTDGNK